MAEEPDSDRRQPEPSGPRLVDRFDPRLVKLITVIGFALPLAVYFWMVHRYSVNVIVSDQLSDMTVIGNSYTHLFDWGSLWAQHNENRIFFPNLIAVLLAHTTHFNVKVEEYLSAIMLVAATALLIWAHKRRSPAAPWLYYCPVALLAFSVVQYENALWGFQMAWYLVLLALAATIVLIDGASLTRLTFSAAAVIAVIGSFSSLQGLLIWPAGLVLLYHRRRPVRYMAVWIGCAVVTAVVYFLHFDTNQGSPHHGYVLHHPLAAVKFYLFALGDVVGIPQQYNGPGNNAVLLLGFVILVLSLATLFVYGWRRDEQGGSPIGVALICVGLLFVATVTVGRILFGYAGASQSRYTTYDLLFPIGIYLAVMGSPVRRPSGDLPPMPAGAELSEGTEPLIGVMARWWHRYALKLMRWVVAAVIAVQIVVGFHYGLQGARTNYAYDVRAVHVLKTIDRSPDALVEYSLDILSPASFIRHQVRIAQKHHLSVFYQGSGS
jgi:hypothetical protein